jgi:formylglycine-generating enzyme required for sulfatase activity
MMRIKLALAVLLTGCLLVPSLWSRVQSQRGQGVRIKVENGQEIDLYAESHALVIGVRKYTNGWSELPGAENDAEAIRDLLQRQGFEVTVSRSPTKAPLYEALDTFINERGFDRNNRLLIYFAGHGHTEKFSDGRELGYIVPADAPRPERDLKTFNRLAFSMDEIEAAAKKIISKHALFVFDSCFSGSIFDIRGESNAPAEIESKTAYPVRMFITAGNRNQSVPDASIFRRYFVRAFEQREGDSNGDGFITGEELGNYLVRRVAIDSKNAQTPQYGKIRDVELNAGDIVFALPRREVPRPNSTPGSDTGTIELQMWQSAERGNELSDYEEYLKKYPQGSFAGMARNRIDRLRAAATNTTSATPNTVPSTRMSVAGVPLVAMSFETAEVDERGKIIKRWQEQRWGYMEDLGNGVMLEMIEISEGEFLMGEDTGGAAEFTKECLRYGVSKGNCAYYVKSQRPQRRVQMNGYLMGKYEVTQRQWKAVMGGLPPAMSDLPAEFISDDLPVVMVSWHDVQIFLQRLGKGYRLPSEAEWEYAARAGRRIAYAFGPTISPAVVNYDGNYPYGQSSKGENRGRPVAVGSLRLANGWGLFDMHGNVMEWCEDDWHDSYNGAPRNGLAWISDRRSNRILRGGSWGGYAIDCRSAFRGESWPGHFSANVGFRLVRS